LTSNSNRILANNLSYNFSINVLFTILLCNFRRSKMLCFHTSLLCWYDVQWRRT